MSCTNFDILWEVVIQRGYKILKSMSGRSKEVDNLALCVCSGVCTACASNPNRLTGEMCQCFLQLLSLIHI